MNSISLEQIATQFKKSKQEFKDRIKEKDKNGMIQILFSTTANQCDER